MPDIQSDDRPDVCEVFLLAWHCPSALLLLQIHLSNLGLDWHHSATKTTSFSNIFSHFSDIARENTFYVDWRLRTNCWILPQEYETNPFSWKLSIKIFGKTSSSILSNEWLHFLLNRVRKYEPCILFWKCPTALSSPKIVMSSHSRHLAHICTTQT